ncbi:MAG: PxxKW family cysteine-rich protein [Humidesulfovibrio sp.]|uniref:PxxKW family cysteine-rich protein n=1 Tax=Humidesulfovibrio sp. TaxID=2910988 RepID=UPI0027EC5247|nr:PxxKW family cysteine-rich protein [Humidesulfovibrio sp.]MDQ7834494.1 PxxKW family cysteine-rich protein [Humidesulfovibrio sp.]
MAEEKKKASALDGAVMTAEGLSFKGVIMNAVVENCTGCDRIAEFDNVSYCPSYAQPAAKWSRGICNFATHVKGTLDKQGKAKVNPLKASKRAARGR